MEITINIKNCGNAIGTLGWFNELMSDSEFLVRKTRDGIPGMFLHEKHKADGTERKPSEGNTFICCPASGSQQEEGYNISKINSIEYIVVQPTSDAKSKYIYGEDIGFTDYPITPACKSKIIEMLEYATEKFAEWYENQ